MPDAFALPVCPDSAWREVIIGPMNELRLALRRWLNQEDDGQTLVEYALLIAMISILVIVALVFLGPILSRVFQNVGTTLNSA